MNVVHGDSCKSRTEWFKETAKEALRDRMSVKPGKGSRWRTINSDRFRDNYDLIFNKPKVLAANESN